MNNSRDNIPDTYEAETNSDISGNYSSLEDTTGTEFATNDNREEQINATDLLINIASSVMELRQIIEERLSYDSTKEEAFDKLYVEVDEARQERTFQQVRPLLIDLLLLFDRIESCRKDMNKHMPNHSDFDVLLKTISDELLEILYRREVEMIVSQSSSFDRSFQQVVGMQPVTSLAEHNQVIRVIRHGFRYRNRILRPEEIILGNYKPTEHE
jgi:molecular chaperone GrpE